MGVRTGGFLGRESTEGPPVADRFSQLLGLTWVQVVVSRRANQDGATRCGAAHLAARTETELRATGARPRRIALRGVESLTPSERRVAELAAEGPTNREIAQALFVTPRTVEAHLTSVYRKLDIGSRSELSAALGEPSRV